MTKGIIFDFGGTIDTNGIHWEKVLFRFYQKAGIEIDENSFHSIYVQVEKMLGRTSIIEANDTLQTTLRKKIELENEIVAGLETETTNTIKENDDTEKTNFLDRDEFLQFLNSRANAIKDDKLRNDILKMLSDNLRYKDTERDENNEIQRFYTPVTCENCTIYNKCKDCKLSKCPEML